MSVQDDVAALLQRVEGPHTRKELVDLVVGAVDAKPRTLDTYVDAMTVNMKAQNSSASYRETARRHPLLWQREDGLRERYDPQVHELQAGRCPAWTRDEVLLALSLYVRRDCLRGGALPGKTDPEVLQLSEVLQHLPIHSPQDKRSPTFRNGQGVAQKLANLRAAERDARLARDEPDSDQLPKGMRS